MTDKQYLFKKEERQMSNKSQTVQILLTIPKSYRDRLRTLAAEENLRNPDHVVTGSYLAKEFLCESLDKHLQDKKESRGEART